MSQPTYERLAAQLDRLGLWRAKQTLPETLKFAEDESREATSRWLAGVTTMCFLNYRT